MEMGVHSLCVVCVCVVIKKMYVYAMMIYQAQAGARRRHQLRAVRPWRPRVQQCGRY